MLTATYSLIAIRAEQDKANSLLSRLRQYVESAWQGLQQLEFSMLEAAFNKLLHFDENCRMRKVELYLIPALRRCTREADALLAELDAFSGRSGVLLRSVRSRLAGVFETGQGAAREVCRLMEQYCECMQARLRIEETELFPLALRVLSIDEWFSVAAQFLSDESGSGRGYGNSASQRRPGGGTRLTLH